MTRLDLDAIAVGPGRTSGEASASSVVDDPRRRTERTSTRGGGVGGVEGQRKPARGPRRRHLSPALLLGPALLFATGCPPDPVDGPPVDDDDDDAAVDCAVQGELTPGGGEVAGDTTLETNEHTASCVTNPQAEAVFVLEAPADATYNVSTATVATGDFDTVLYAFSDCDDAAATELACNDDAAPGAGVFASEIVLDLAAGEVVYVAVEGYDAEGAFGIVVDEVVCGDGNLAATEDCDDGNTEDGDGCDSACAWECDDEDANEDDDVVGQAPALDLPGEFDGFLCPTDVSEEYGVFGDFWAVTIDEDDADAYLAVEATGGAEWTPECADQTLAAVILDAEVQILGYGDSTEGECARAVAEPGAGTFYVGVFWDDPSVGPQDYHLAVTSAVSVCGDGTLEGLEECDDGGTEPGDGCTPDCVVEDECVLEDGDLADILDAEGDDASVTGATEEDGPNLHEPSCATGGSPDVTYLFTAAADGPVVFSLDNAGTDYDTVLHIRSVCEDPGAEVACNDDIDGANGVRTSWAGVEAEAGASYAVIVDGWGGDFGAHELTVFTPECGDATVQPTEECDDGNDEDGDGCETDCTATPACDSTLDEDAGTLASATPVTVTVATTGDDVTDALCSAAGGGDALVGFTLDAAAAVTVDVSLTDGVDAQFELWGPGDACERLADSCFDPYPELTGSFTTELDAGAWFLVVDAWSADFEGEVEVTLSIP